VHIEDYADTMRENWVLHMLGKANKRPPCRSRCRFSAFWPRRWTTSDRIAATPLRTACEVAVRSAILSTTWLTRTRGSQPDRKAPATLRR
jgi:hypothetical protein